MGLGRTGEELRWAVVFMIWTLAVPECAGKRLRCRGTPRLRDRKSLAQRCVRCFKLQRRRPTRRHMLSRWSCDLCDTRKAVGTNDDPFTRRTCRLQLDRAPGLTLSNLWPPAPCTAAAGFLTEVASCTGRVWLCSPCMLSPRTWPDRPLCVRPNVRAKRATAAWRAGQQAQNGAKPQR